jgi:hypothetical protein
MILHWINARDMKDQRALIANIELGANSCSCCGIRLKAGYIDAIWNDRKRVRSVAKPLVIASTDIGIRYYGIWKSGQLSACGKA